MLNELPEHIKIPNAESGLLLSPYKGLWSLIVPERAINYVEDPRFNNASLWFTPGLATFQRILTDSATGGGGCLEVSPTGAGVSYVDWFDSSLSTSPQIFSFGCWVKGFPGETFNVLTTSGFKVQNFKANGSWQRLEATSQSSSGTLRFQVQKNELTTNKWYTDGWQVEQSDKPTTFFDGNTTGCFWYGQPNFSYSERPASLPVGQIGGRIYDLEELGFSVTAYQGADMVEVQNVATPLALRGGSQYQRTTVPPRTFTLSGVIEGENLYEVQRKLAVLNNLVSPDISRQQAPALALQFQLYDYAGKVPQGKPVRVPVVYAGGLGGLIDNLNQTRRSVQFVEYQPPSVEEITQGHANLNFRTTLTASAETLGQGFSYNLAKNNTWARFLGATGQPNANRPVAVTTSLRPKRFFGALAPVGSDQLVIGASTQNSVPATYQGVFTVQSDGRTRDWQNTNNTVLAFATDATNNLYAGGAYTTPQNYLMRFSPSTGLWTALGTGVNNVIRAMVQTINPTTGEERIYVGGDLTSAGGTAVAKLAYWSPGSSTWNTLLGASSGISGGAAVVNALAVGRDGTLYIGGGFTTATGGVSCSNIVGYNPTTATFFALGAGVSNTVRSLAVHPLTGELYAAGDFTTAGGITVNYIAKWNGTNWQALGFGLNNTVNSIDFDESGVLYLGGTFTKSGAVGAAAYTFPNKLCKWDGTNFLPIDLNVGWIPAPTVNHIVAFDEVNTIVVGTAAAAGVAAVYTGATTTVTYDGTAPGDKTKLYFVGPGLLYEVTNLTTGLSLYFKDCYIASGETVVLDLETGKFSSNVRPSLAEKILPGPMNTWALMPGDNIIKIYFDNSTPGTSSVVANYKKLNFGVNAVAGQV